jgi:hypothetical protein
VNSVVEGIRFLWAWMESWFPWKKKEKPTGPQVERYVLNDYHFPGNDPNPDKRHKKFADERQKAKRNRRRKPKKAMKRLYQLGRNKAHPMARRS